MCSPPATEPALALHGVTLALGARTVLRDVSFAVAPGEVIAVLGMNGAGKTTLMRAILGVVPLAAGCITRKAGAVGYLPQTRTLAAARHIRARDLLAVSVRGTAWGLPVLGRAGRAAIERALALTDAEELSRRPLGALSGGERQRVLLAQALLGDPTLLLLDEPLSGLDTRRQAETIALIGRLRRETGVTVLLSAHGLDPLLGQIDRVLYLREGRAALGRVEDVLF